MTCPLLDIRYMRWNFLASNKVSQTLCWWCNELGCGFQQKWSNHSLSVGFNMSRLLSKILSSLLTSYWPYDETTMQRMNYHTLPVHAMVETLLQIITHCHSLPLRERRWDSYSTKMGVAAPLTAWWWSHFRCDKTANAAAPHILFVMSWSKRIQQFHVTYYLSVMGEDLLQGLSSRVWCHLQSVWQDTFRHVTDGKNRVVTHCLLDIEWNMIELSLKVYLPSLS